MRRRITRRQVLAEAAIGAALLAGCGSSGGESESGSGSTVFSAWADPTGGGTLQRAGGEVLIARTELGSRRPATAVLATLAHVTDAHVLDASSPARVPFLDRLGAPFQSTFRPHETLTAQVLAGAARAVRALSPHAVIQGGDLIDNAQHNELQFALRALRGGIVRPGSGRHGYFGVQIAQNPDPFYYRPDLDAPRHPGLLSSAVRPFRSSGLGAPVYPVLGDHDILAAGEIAPSEQTRALATGDQALWELPPDLELPPGTSLTSGGSPDGPPNPLLVDQFLARALAGPKVRVPADPRRRELSSPEAVARLRAASRLPAGSGLLDYRVDIGESLRLIVLDLARRGGGSGGLVHPGQPEWLSRELDGARRRWVIVISHQPLASSQGGEQLLALLDEHPRVLAAISGHTHRNRIVPRPSEAGGYWLINTASLIDYPQQSRAMRVLSTAGGGVALQTWMLDHVFPGDLGLISRQLAYLDAQGGRAHRFAGGRLDRNVTLYRAPTGS
jgi:3',5'-cyclic AMP phosphodiesterase CpdA